MLVTDETPDELPEVARIARDLIRFDTTNYGEGRSNGEREAAEYVGAFLESLGLKPEFYEPIPRRTNLSVRIPGRDRASRRSSSTATSTSFPPSRRTGASIPSRASSRTGCCGAGARST